MRYRREPAKELWAVLNENDEVMYTGGGSSTSPKLMIYESEAKAKAQLKYQGLASTCYVDQIFSSE